MALTPIIVPAYPTVPNSPGVPTLSRALNTATSINNVVATTVGVVSRVSSLLFPKVWGVFDDNGDPVLVADTIRSVGYRVDYHVPDYQIEEGGFGTYNKTASPFDTRLSMIKSGTVDEKIDFIRQLKNIVESLDLFSIITPEDTFESVNLTGFAYDRDLRHSQAIEFEITFKEIRIVEAGQFTETKDATGKATENNGTVSESPQTPAQTKAASTKKVVAKPSPSSLKDYPNSYPGVTNAAS